MQSKTQARVHSRVRTDASPDQKSDDRNCAVCGNYPATGLDAEDRLPKCRRCANIRADGGQVHADEQAGDAETDDALDPLALNPYKDPAVVEAKAINTQHGWETDEVAVASADVRASGALWFEQWDGRNVILPPWRWCGVSFLHTEPVEDDGFGPTTSRVAPEDLDRLPDDVRERAEGGESA